jgi:hypothetical protein
MQANHPQSGAKIECGNYNQKISKESPGFFTLDILYGYKSEKASEKDVNKA